MIGHLAGTVSAVRPGYAIISAGSVGYKVFATRELLLTLKQDAEASVWTHLAVRESILDLYGFSNEETLRSAISAGNASYLTKVSGIGKKTAEKIVLELRDKVGASQDGSGASLRGDEEALEAMRALGYSQGEARDALRKVPQEIERSSERLREALRILGSHKK